ncbi:hypothetical protein A0H81_02927 [Grifola frondosa]|uniref:Uncharacterized protein n=1 Tax=Grifola frondosa TaxID=5627 RepID=A0A1C7MKB0_GRIFR|nr:hypothetical protein A0H81_02927 [Grifola frondosa]
MVDWHDPLVIQENYASGAILIYVTGGIFLWEWVTNLYLDWSLFSAIMVRWKWPTLLYLLTRLSTLITVICLFISINVKRELDCNASIHVILGFGYFAMALSSCLIAFRIAGIWNRRPSIVIFVTVAVFVNTAFFIYALITNGGSVWVPEAKACIELHTVRNRLNTIVAFATDVLMLIVMLVGIWVKRASGGLYRLVYRQGIIWFLVAIIFYVPLVVLVTLNLNDAMNVLFQMPVCIAMTLCATRMHRGLYEYANTTHVVAEISESTQFNSISYPVDAPSNLTTENTTPAVPIVHAAENDKLTNIGSTICSEV